MPQSFKKAESRSVTPNKCQEREQLEHYNGLSRSSWGKTILF